jgi:hypothetical protein
MPASRITAPARVFLRSLRFYRLNPFASLGGTLRIRRSSKPSGLL